MWIVRLALRRPYTFVVLALLIAVLGILSILTMTVDIFPRINIPVVNVIWNYGGLSPTEMQSRIVTVTERAFTTTVDGIEHIESVALRGIAVTRLLLSSQCADRGGHRAGERPGATDRAHLTPWHLSTAHPSVQRRQRSGAVGESEQRSTARAATLRSRQQLHPHSAGHCPGFSHPGAVRRQGPCRERRHRSRRALRARVFASRRQQRDPCAERHPAGRHGEDGNARVRCRDQRQPGDSERLE